MKSLPETMFVTVIVIVLSLVNQVNTFKVHGNIKSDGNNSSLPENSWLTIRVEDTSRKDRASFELAKQVYPIEILPRRIPYKIKNVITPESVDMPGYEITISAVINVGWKPEGYQWIRRGDYLSQSYAAIPYIKGKRSYKINIPITKYD